MVILQINDRSDSRGCVFSSVILQETKQAQDPADCFIPCLFAKENFTRFLLWQKFQHAGEDPLDMKFSMYQAAAARNPAAGRCSVRRFAL